MSLWLLLKGVSVGGGVVMIESIGIDFFFSISSFLVSVCGVLVLGCVFSVSGYDRK